MNRLNADLGVDSGQMGIFPASWVRSDAVGDLADLALALPVAPGARYRSLVDQTGMRLVEDRRGDFTVPDGCDRLIVADPCYVLAGEYDTDDPYGRACSVSDDVRRFTVPDRAGEGLCTGTMYGDGEYSAHAELDDRGNLVAFEISFVDDDEDDDS